MTTNKPINILEMNDDILQLIQTELIAKRKCMALKLQKQSLIQVINNMHIFLDLQDFQKILKMENQTFLNGFLMMLIQNLIVFIGMQEG